MPVLRDVVRNMLIKTIDSHWQQHLLAIDNLRAEVSMRVVGQKDPLMEFKHEAFALFDTFSQEIKTTRCAYFVCFPDGLTKDR